MSISRFPHRVVTLTSAVIVAVAVLAFPITADGAANCLHGTVESNSIESFRYSSRLVMLTHLCMKTLPRTLIRAKAQPLADRLRKWTRETSCCSACKDRAKEITY